MDSASLAGLCWLGAEHSCSSMSGVCEKGKSAVGEICRPVHQAHGIYGPRTDLHPDSCRKACCLFMGKSTLNLTGLEF